MLYVTLSNSRQETRREHERGPLEFGRGPQRDFDRIVVEDRYTSRDQLRIEALASGRLRIENLGGPATLSSGQSLDSGQSCEVPLPVRISFGYTTVDIAVPSQLPGQQDVSLRTIDAPLQKSSAPSPSHTLGELGESPSATTLARWFERLLAVQRAVAGSGEFYGETARALVELVGLDRGLVLLRRDANWIPQAHFPDGTEQSLEVSHRVLEQVLRERRTFFDALDQQELTHSLAGVEAVVASPIFDQHDALVGVVYGVRDLRSSQTRRRGIQPLEAQIVQLLAGAVSAGLARLEHEREAAQTRVQFEQFFSSELALALESNPALLKGQEREITVLFCDLRGFSRMSERAGAQQTYALLGDVMDRFTIRIMEFGGVVIDYYGDGLAAMWNAPTDDPDHVQRAAQAALAMLRELPAINQAWSTALGGPIAIGIGVNTGMAQVGNAGSRRRLKYGPRGHTVNLASRIEGATKLLRVPCLVSQFAEQQLPENFFRRRICRARLTGMTEPIHLYELMGQPSDDWRRLQNQYERALLHYEQARFAECLRECADLAGSVGQGDAPTMMLAQKASAQLSAPSEDFEPVYRLDIKG
jgi:adenylate cyclase